MNTPSERDRDPPDDANWATVEKLVRSDIVAEVRCKNNYTAGHPPLYSVRVGRARFAENGELVISPHMSIYDLPIASELLLELGEKYRDLRAQQQGRRVVEAKRSTRMGMSKDGMLEVSAAHPAPARRPAPGTFYDRED